MKRTVHLFLLALAAAVLSFSCQKPAELNEPSSGEATVRTFTCTFAAPDSRVAIANDGKTTWETGDEILIHAGADGDESIIVTLASSDISEDGKTATITVEGLDPYNREDAHYKSQFYAIYPASAVTSDRPLYYNTRIDDFTIPAMGGYDDGEGHMVFRNLCGVITFQVSGDFDSFTFEGQKGETVTYAPQCQWRVAWMANDGNEYEYFELKLTSDHADCQAQTIITSPVVADGSTLNYVCIPNGANLTGGFIFKFYKGDTLVKIAKTAHAVNMKCGSLLSLGDISAQLKDEEDPGQPGESAITIDGDPSDWDDAENVVSLECPASASMTGLESAKILYSDKLYFLVKLSSEMDSYDWVNMHIYFDTDDTGALASHWTDGGIDYMTEGQILNDGQFVSYSSTLYKWNGTAETPWAWTDSEFTPGFEGAGNGRYYELSMDYDGYPGDLPEEFSIGLDVVNSEWATFGFLPQTGHMLVVKKDGLAEQPSNPDDPGTNTGITIDGDFSDWASIEGVDGEATAPTDGIVTMKAAGDSEKLYIYLEVKNDHLNYSTDFKYCNYATLCLSDGEGEKTTEYFSRTYDKHLQFWFLYKQVISFKQWSTDMPHQELLEDGILKMEFSIPRSFHDCLSGSEAWIGLFYNGQNTDQSEVWGSYTDDLLGCAPALGSDMLRVAFN